MTWPTTALTAAGDAVQIIVIQVNPKEAGGGGPAVPTTGQLWPRGNPS